MSRRPVNSNRRLLDGGGLPLATSLQSKTNSSPLLTIGLVVLVILFLYHRIIILECVC
jgi:putative pectin methylesterase